MDAGIASRYAENGSSDSKFRARWQTPPGDFKSSSCRLPGWTMTAANEAARRNSQSSQPSADQALTVYDGQHRVGSIVERNGKFIAFRCSRSPRWAYSRPDVKRSAALPPARSSSARSARTINAECFPVPCWGWAPSPSSVETIDPQLKEHGPGGTSGRIYRRHRYRHRGGISRILPVAHEAGQNLPREAVHQWLRRELEEGRAEDWRQPDLRPRFPGRPPASLCRDRSMTCRLRSPCSTKTAAPTHSSRSHEKYLGEHKVEQTLSDWMTRGSSARRTRTAIWKAPSHIVAPYAIGDVDLPLRIFA